MRRQAGGEGVEVSYAVDIVNLYTAGGRHRTPLRCILGVGNARRRVALGGARVLVIHRFRKSVGYQLLRRMPWAFRRLRSTASTATPMCLAPYSQRVVAIQTTQVYSGLGFAQLTILADM